MKPGGDKRIHGFVLEAVSKVCHVAKGGVAGGAFGAAGGVVQGGKEGFDAGPERTRKLYSEEEELDDGVGFEAGGVRTAKGFIAGDAAEEGSPLVAIERASYFVRGIEEEVIFGIDNPGDHVGALEVEAALQPVPAFIVEGC